MPTLGACVKQILCGLSTAILNALNGIISAQIAVLQALLLALEAKLLGLDILTIPLEVARSAALLVIAKIRSGAGLVPLELIAGCVDLGDFNINLTTSIDQATAVFVDIVDDLNRLLSFKEEVRQAIEEFTTIIEQFDLITLAIAECGT